MTYLLLLVSKFEKDDNLSVTIVDHDDRYILIKNLLCRLCLGMQSIIKSIYIAVYST